VRLVGAILLERNDEWAVQRARYMTLETISQMSDDPLISLPAVATRSNVRLTMHETLSPNARVRPRISHAVIKHFRELEDSVIARSQIVWEEHCTECAFPTCYASCSFYTPRQDLHCRRFAKGIVPSVIDGLQLMSVEFRKWGKLEGVGPNGMIKARSARRRARVDHLVSEVITRYTPSYRLSRIAKNRWNALKTMAQLNSNEAEPDAFLIEAYRDDAGPTLPCTLTIVSKELNSGLYQTRFELVQGYNRVFASRIEIEARVDLSKPYLIQIEPVGNTINQEILFGILDFVRLRSSATKINEPWKSTKHLSKDAKERTAKCVVWDLDNTLWRGTLAEDGMEVLVVDQITRDAVLELDRRGILQSVVSKNDPEPAFAALEAFGLREYFLFPQISWEPKSQALRRLAELLDISIDSFVFIDDQAFERGEVKDALPTVTVLADSDNLLDRPLFDVPATAESAKRRSMYQVEERRQAVFSNSELDYISFLRGCAITIDIAALSTGHIDRAYELSQRTNQLNVSGRRYSRDEIESMLKKDSRSCGFILRCEDRFGDYGIIGLCVIDRHAPIVESFMMSCRVQRKRVEHAFFAWLCRYFHHRGAKSISIQYQRTQRNAASIKMLGELGFDYREQGPERGLFVRDTATRFPDHDVVIIKDVTR
jgi:FkbH-like protein